jgi:hypothetical protein
LGESLAAVFFCPAGGRREYGLLWVSGFVKFQSALALGIIAATWLAFTPANALGQKPQRDRITREETLSSPHRGLDLYQLIRAVRPHFLQRPAEVRALGGSRPAASLAVYVDGVRETGPDALRTLTAARVQEVRHLDQTSSENEFGSRANGGAVLVRLYRAPRDVRPARDSAPRR